MESCACIAYTNNRVNAVNGILSTRLYPNRFKELEFGLYPNTQLMSYLNISKIEDNGATFSVLQILTNCCVYKVVDCSKEVTKYFDLSVVDDNTFVNYGVNKIGLVGYSVLLKNMMVADMEDSNEEKKFVASWIEANERGATKTQNAICGAYSSIFIVSPKSYHMLMYCYLHFVTLKFDESGGIYPNNKVRLTPKLKMTKASYNIKQRLKAEHEFLTREALTLHDIYFKPQLDENYQLRYVTIEFSTPVVLPLVNEHAIEQKETTLQYEGVTFTTAARIVEKALAPGDALTCDKLQGGEKAQIAAFMSDLRIAFFQARKDWLKKMYVAASRIKQTFYMVYDTV